jgi:VirC2 protein
MAIRKPAVSVQEARRLSSARSEAGPSTPLAVAPPELAEEIVEVAPRPEEPAPPPPPAVQPKPERQSPAAVAPIRQAPYAQQATIGLRIQVFVSAAFPQAGVSASFDALCAKYPPAKALQMILRRAMDEYEDRLADGSFTALADTYPAAGDRLVQTSRIMPQELADLARLHFDPLGFESARAFGLKLATAALASFFASERLQR